MESTEDIVQRLCMEDEEWMNEVIQRGKKTKSEKHLGPIQNQCIVNKMFIYIGRKREECNLKFSPAFRKTAAKVES